MSADSWDNFWKHSAKEQSMPCFGAQTDVLKHAWDKLFEENLTSISSGKVLDIACGDGTLISRFAEAKERSFQLFACDYSYSACLDAFNRNVAISSVCCDSANLPFESETFDIILSQYGIEYAGQHAFFEALRCLKPGGELVTICHALNGSIFKECTENANAAERFLSSGILNQGKSLFAVAGEVMSGKRDKADFVEEDRAFSKTVMKCKALFDEVSPQICGGYLFKVYSELGQMFSQIQSYKTQDVLDWIDKTQAEVVAYQSRMFSMTQSAMSQRSLDAQFETYQSSTSDNQSSWQVLPLYGAGRNESKAQEDLIGWMVIFSKK